MFLDCFNLLISIFGNIVSLLSGFELVEGVNYLTVILVAIILFIVVSILRRG